MIRKIIAGILIITGVVFMIVIKLNNFLGYGFIIGAILAFWGCYILLFSSSK